MFPRRNVTGRSSFQTQWTSSRNALKIPWNRSMLAFRALAYRANDGETFKRNNIQDHNLGGPFDNKAKCKFSVLWKHAGTRQHVSQSARRFADTRYAKYICGWGSGRDLSAFIPIRSNLCQWLVELMKLDQGNNVSLLHLHKINPYSYFCRWKFGLYPILNTEESANCRVSMVNYRKKQEPMGKVFEVKSRPPWLWKYAQANSRGSNGQKNYGLLKTTQFLVIWRHHLKEGDIRSMVKGMAVRE